MTRRQLVKSLLAVPFLGAACASGGSEYRQEGSGPGKFVLGVPLTHSDWVLREGVPFGEEGVRHMLDACKACGWSRIYWRVLDSGNALYKSKLRDPMGAPDADTIFNPIRPEDKVWTQSMSEEARAGILKKMAAWDYAHFDTLASAVRYGCRIGLEIHAWVTINEDDHGWGWVSRFSRAHSEFRWRRRDGSFYRSQLSFAFPEVRRHKLAIIEEIARGYDVDGFFIDWLRTGDVRDNPQTDPEGVANYGYEEPLVKGFQARYRIDPHTIPNGDDRWVGFRARPQTLFMRSVRKNLRFLKPGLPLSVMVAHPWCYRGYQNKIDGSLKGMLLDVGTWAREGLIDEAVAAGYYMDGGTPEKAYQSLKAETGGKANIWLYGWVPETAEGFEADCALAARLGAGQILFWEADYIDGRANKETLQQAMRERSRPAKRLAR
ncbi:MAG: family 10 glycosylhydrolase [Armatimonadetes bacterium]|nr:family 10 glycosylhydrolase [Armatimonadota bacterium]